MMLYLKKKKVNSEMPLKKNGGGTLNNKYTLLLRTEV